MKLFLSALVIWTVVMGLWWWLDLAGVDEGGETGIIGAVVVGVWIIGVFVIGALAATIQRGNERFTQTAAVVAAAEESGMTVRPYRAKSEAAARLLYEADEPRMEADGYNSVQHQWVPGNRGPGPYLLAGFLCLWLIGIPLLIYLLWVKPDGSLLVTFERPPARPAPHPAT